mmetsp:Transcript_14489/g.12757  ORF Transcript_14489/g.12757 Transcript_14489/m.12757 type:complete len:134 (+) Transcript_14489:3-404(+)
MSSQVSDKESVSIYEKFKKNTQKIFNEDSFKEGLDKGYQMLNNREISKNSKKRHESLSDVKPKSRNRDQDYDDSRRNRVSSLVNNSVAAYPTPLKNSAIKIKVSPKKHPGHPIKLDKNLKSIENRILQKMKNK